MFQFGGFGGLFGVTKLTKDPAAQSGDRTPGGNCWHGIRGTHMYVHR